MTEEVKDATQAEAKEPQEQPTPAMPSPASPETGSAQQGPDVGAIVEQATAKIKQELESLLDQKVDARFKSAKDKRFSKVEEIYAWVQQAGGNVDAIKSDLEIQDLKEQIASLQGGQKSAVATAAPLDSDWSVAQAKTDIILKGAGIAPDDAEYNVLVSQYQGRITADKWPDIVETFAKSRRGGSPAAVVAEAGASAPVSADAETLTERLNAATRSGAPASEIQKLHDELQAALKS